MTEISRRAFLQGSAVAAGGLVIGCGATRNTAPADFAGSEGMSFDAFLKITSDDRIILQVDKVEMGQGTMTGMATLVAEELDIEPHRIELVHPNANPVFQTPLQITGGSNSMAARWQTLRESGARAREMLKSAAAERWGVESVQLEARNGAIVDPATGNTLSYGALAEAAARQPVPGDIELKPREQYRWIGREFARVDGPTKLRGEARYGIDTRIPGMLRAVVVRCPHAKGRLSSFDASQALGMPGVHSVFEISNGVAVVADRTWRALRAADAVVCKYDLSESRGISTESIRAEHRRMLDDAFGAPVTGSGGTVEPSNPEDLSRSLDVVYTIPHVAHVTMEPLNCAIDIREDRVDVTLGTQAPDVIQHAVSRVLGRPRREVIIHNAFLGGGFGRRAFPDVAIEAAEIAKQVDAPVQLVWSREDDLANDYYRPATTHRIRGEVDADGNVARWDHRMVAPSLIPYMAKGMGGVLAPEWMAGAVDAVAESVAGLVPRLMGPILATEGASELPYRVEKHRFDDLFHDPGIPVGIWRSVGHSHNGFVVESFVDELAHQAGRDPAAFRRDLLGDDHPRHRAVLDLALETSGWSTSQSASDEGRHRGLAVHESFNSVVAQVVEVRIDDDREIHVERIVCAVDCGTVVNPDIVRAQMEGGIFYGLTAALKGPITFENGAAQQSNFHDYEMLRMREAPRVEVAFVDSDAPPTGVGEPGTPPIAAAVANAVFAATGERLRDLPLRLPKNA